MKNKAFTLIELLVVIAIIAILAAILFPVFAQAKAAAKAAADLSNTKQTSLGMLMYAADVDDQFPYAFDNDWGTPLVWPVITQPYVKSISLYHSPLDTNSLIATSDYDANAVAGFGAAISMGSNSTVLWDAGYGGQNENACQGPIVYFPANSWPSAGCDSVSQTQISKVAETIMLADRFSVDLQKSGDPGNPSAVPAGNVFVYSSVQYGSGGSLSQEFFDGAIPDGTVSTSNKYPFGPNGGVSITNANRSNFAFTDGHTKSMTPTQTNPDTWNKPAQNMWSARRS